MNWWNSIANIGIIICLYLLISIISKNIHKRKSEKSTDKSLHAQFRYRLLRGVMYVMTGYMIMQQIPIFNGLTGFIGNSSSLMVAVMGFAAQEALSNIINGVFLSVSKPFEVGDRVRIPSIGITGNIEEMTLRHVIIRTVDNKRLIVPNSTLNKEIVENVKNDVDEACNFLDIGISYESDIDRAISVIKEIVRNHKYFLDRRSAEEIEAGAEDVSVLVRNLGESSIDLRCTIWTSDVSKNFVMCSDVRKAIVEGFKECGIEIPYKHIKIVNDTGLDEVEV